MTQIDSILHAIDANQQAALARLFELLSIPSVSTDPAYKGECQRAGQWLVDDLNQIGFAGGSMIDPVASALFCAPVTANYTVINGRFIVKEGHITTLDLPNIIAKCNKAAARIVNG
jgi:acetylornithine deacetylase/succinyl-diaminopimelate desuccinylase-like protein